MHSRDTLALTDFTTRFCILEPFCSTEDRCRTGRARIPRMPYLSLFVLPTLSLLLPHPQSITLSVARSPLALRHWGCSCVSLYWNLAVAASSTLSFFWIQHPAELSLCFQPRPSLFGWLTLHSLSLLGNHRCVTISFLTRIAHLTPPVISLFMQTLRSSLSPADPWGFPPHGIYMFARLTHVFYVASLSDKGIMSSHHFFITIA